MKDLQLLHELPDRAGLAVVWPAVGDCEPVGNELAALAFVATAMELGETLPPSVAAWLAGGIRAYLAAPASVTLGAALGLEGRAGHAEIKRATKDTQVVLARWLAMTRLYSLGATKDQAATLAVARYPGASVETVTRQLSSADAAFLKPLRAYWKQRLTRSQLAAFLALFPDEVTTAAAKRALLKLYPS